MEQEIIEMYKEKWKTMDETKLIAMIRKQIVKEIMNLEERKEVNEERKRLEAKKRLEK